MTTELADMTFSQIIAGVGAWIIILFIFAPGVVNAVAAILAVLCVAGAFTLLVSYRLLITLGEIADGAFRVLGPRIGRIGLFLGFVLLEAFRRSTPEPEPEFDSEPPPGHPPHDKLAWALSTLGLTRVDLTPETLKQAYRRAIRTAHPDLNGSAEEAMRINRARDAIRAHFGWN